MKKILMAVTILGVAAFAPVAQAHDYHHERHGSNRWHGDYGWHHHPFYHQNHGHVFIGYYPSYYNPYCC